MLAAMLDAPVTVAAAVRVGKRARDLDDDVDMDDATDVDHTPATDYSNAASRRARFDELIADVVARGVAGASAVEGAYDNVELAIELMRVLLERPL